MIILGVTGGIGCGKSTATSLLARHGFRKVDSDQLVREVILPSASVRERLRARFGAKVLRADGELDRPALARIVFSNDEEREWLESELHPHVFQRWREEFAAHPDTDFVVEVPLLFEKGLENWFDFTVCVSTTPSNQLGRLELRGMTRAQAEARISKQLSLARKQELADVVITNDGTLAFLERQVALLVRGLASNR